MTGRHGGATICAGAAVLWRLMPHVPSSCRMPARLAVALGLGACAAGGLAETVYKSIDAQGVVTYSETRPGNAASSEIVEVRATPARRIEEGVTRLEEMRDAAQAIATERDERREAEHERARRIAEAEAELREAERSLAEARASKKSATPERIARHAEKVRLARQRLDEVRGGE